MQATKPLCNQARLASLGLATCVTVMFVLAPARADAIPAFARQFNATCNMCHAPLPPRLNNLGITFKRLGYRLPDVDDQGRGSVGGLASRVCRS